MVGNNVGFGNTPGKGDNKNGTAATRLFLRKDKPANDAPSYSSEDPGEFLGYCVGRISLPRWMSMQFHNAAEDEVEPDKYSQDWVHKILYVPAGAKPTGKEKTLVNSLVGVLPALKLPYDSGCGVSGPRTVLQPVTMDANGETKLKSPNKKLYYALASNHARGNIHKITEWTVASQANRAKLENSALHQTVIARYKPSDAAIQKAREQMFAAVRGLPPDFKP